MAAVKKEGFEFVIAKVSEGSAYVNPVWREFRDGARENDLLLIAYHYLTGEPAEAQAENLMSNLGDSQIPVMLDLEVGGGDLVHFRSLAEAIAARNGNVALSYIPRWYWQQIGSPDLASLPGLVASHYVSGAGFASELYPGDKSAFWAPYGGADPVILQFTDSAIVDGRRIDADAYRGAAADLRSRVAS